MPPKAKATPAKEKAKAKDEKKITGPPAPPMPNRDAFNEKMNVKNTEIANLQRQMDAIKEQLQAKSSEKNEYYESRTKLGAELSSSASYLSELNEQKHSLKSGLSKKGEEKRAAFDEIKKIEGMSQFKSVQDVDAAIQKIEFQLFTNTVKLSEEKRLVQQIQSLKKVKQSVPKLAAQLEKLNEKTTQLTMDNNEPALESLKSLTERGNQVWEEMNAVAEKRKKLETDFNAKHSDIAVLNTKMADLRKKVQENVTEKNSLRDAFREEEKKYWDWEKEIRKLKREQQETERLKDKAKWDAQKMERDVEKLNVQPYLAEITALEQSLIFLKALLPKESTDQEKKQEVDFNNPEGSVVLMSKKDRDEEMYFIPNKKKGPTKKNKQAVKSNIIKHNAETFRMFEALKINPPSNTDQIPATVEELEKQLVDYNERVVDWKRKLEDGTLHKEFLDSRRKVSTRTSGNETEVAGED